MVQVIRRKLAAQGDHLSWNGLREMLEVQQRVTATFVAEPDLRRIYDALGVNPAPGGVQKHPLTPPLRGCSAARTRTQA
jgi:hypothetical protein